MILPPGSAITLHVGKRKMLLRSEELQKFRADRGRRGTLLPRGLQKLIVLNWMRLRVRRARIAKRKLPG